MRRLVTTSLVILMFITGLQILQCQTKGSFNINVSIITGVRQIAFYVPNDYDSTKKYSLMVCLHGSGQPAYSYRDNLCPSWAGFIKNTIFACPEGGGTAGDFYNAKGDETIIDSAISYTKTNYNIDEKQIILEGFSLGGRSALKYGLDNPDKFKGLLLNTPAVQSQLDVMNIPNFGLNYNYQNGTKLQIALTIGATDPNYVFIVDSVFKILTDMNAKVIFTSVAGMGHAIPGNTVTQNCLNFINNPLNNSIDADITKILRPDRVYEKSFKPYFRMRNRGSSKLTNAQITYTINGTAAKYSWSGSLSPFEHADIQLPEITCNENANTLIVSIDSVNGAYADPNLSVKQYTTPFQCLTQGIQLPIEFGFELTEPTLDLWSLKNSGGMWTWGVYNGIVTTEGSNALMMYNMPFANLSKGLSEDNLSPLMDLTSISNPCIAFDVCFSYIKLTPAGGYNNTYIFSDTLNLLMTVDSGKTYINLYSRTGDQLATTSPITNPASLNACVFSPTSTNQWRTEIIKLNDYKDMKKAAFIWRDVSGMGGTLWLDNIRFMSYDDIAGVDEKTNIKGLAINPNPVTDLINLKIPENTTEIRILNLEGSIIYKQKIESGLTEFHLKTDGFDSGMYLLEAITLDNPISEKFVIVK